MVKLNISQKTVDLMESIALLLKVSVMHKNGLTLDVYTPMSFGLDFHHFLTSGLTTE